MKQKFVLILIFIFLCRTVIGQNISTIAGNGFHGFNGDNIQATAAKLYQPGEVTIDNYGN